MTVEGIRAATRGLLVCGAKDREVAGISTDSRTVKPGDLFVALTGENFDGHDFLRPALEAGACGAVYGRDFPIFKEDAERVLIKVADTLTALGDIAKAYRRDLIATVVGITGSNGKTTTKEITRHLASEKLPVAASPASFNNFVGVPLTLFQADGATRLVALEMGTNRPGEISRLAEIAAPDIGVITNIGRTHLEGLKSIEGVARAKGELLSALPSEAFAILNADDAVLMKMRPLAEATVVTFGLESPADVFAADVKKTAEGFKFLLNDAVPTALNVPGRHNIYNALAAVAVGRRLGIDLEYLAERLSSFRLPSMRLEETEFKGALLINDAYNANPESVACAIGELAGRKGERKFLVIADMLELGDQSTDLHVEIGRCAARAGISFLWATGDAARHCVEGAIESGMSAGSARFFGSLEELASALQRTLAPGDVVLVKASRAMRLERLFDCFK
ncbi:MAG: UDP-N-acetylmuramoyl-tripeptide--D-alanyl-D-alanine ligase [Planctomycetota bacterium]|jgi:UDP-N-acetylmuramoyl-tripeptide--D-alanyl-D-alanine ligase